MNANESVSANADSENFLLVRVGERRFALPAAQVLEIVPAGIATPLPFAPAWVAGLANVGGRVVPMLDAATLLGVTAGAGTEVVLLATTHSPCALRLGEVLAHVPVAREALCRVDSGQGHVTAEFTHDGTPVLVLDPEALGGLLAAEEAPAGDAGLLGALETETQHAVDPGRACLVFEIAGGRYALALDDVGEVTLPPGISPVPGTPASVAGIGLLRSEPLLFVDAARLLGVEAGTPGAALVLSHDGLRIGLLVDRVAAVERFAEERIRILDGEQGDICAVAHDGEGRITSLLGLSRLLGETRRRLLAPLAPAMPHEETAAQKRILEPHLEVVIAGERFGLPLPDVQRIVPWSAPEQLDDGQGRIGGAVNIDGRIVPALDRHLLQRRRGSSDTPPHAWVLLGNGHDGWALAVDDARRIVQVDRERVEDVAGDNPLLCGIASIDQQLLSLVSVRRLAAQGVS